MGMIIKNGVEYNFGSSNTDSSSMEIVTQAEYDALVANGTMDNDKYYFITDTNAGESVNAEVIVPTDITDGEVIDGGYTIIGNLVVVALRLKLTSETTRILVGLPKPIYNVNVIAGAAYCATNNTLKYYWMNSETGVLTVNTQDGIVNNYEYIVSFSYIKA